MQETSKRESRDVEGYEGIYRVWNDGAVESCSKKTGWQWRALKPGRRNKYGHLAVDLCRDGVRRTRHVHELVLEAFVGPRPAGMECRHLNGDPADNRLENLMWGSPKDNAADKLLHGTHNRGERHNMAKLSESDVIEIRRLRAGGMTQQAIADKFGVTRPQVGHICTGRKWPHIKEGL